jgi:voltage-gated potassium channel
VGVLIDGFLITLIGVNVLAFVLETVEPVAARYGGWFDAVLHFSIAVFTLEFLLRLWVAPLHPAGLYNHPIRGRLRYLFSPMMLVDLAAILPYYLGVIAGMDLRFLRLIRLFWILKVTRYFPAMGTLGRVLKRERRTLAAVMVIMLIILFIASSLVYLLEHDRQPEHFASIPQAMWWGMATLSTVGYGDLVPVSPMGRALGVVIMLLGIGTFALPAGILASAFAEERKRRDFMVTWNLVAQVPSFASLTAREIADIAALLRPREVLPAEVVFQKGEEADSMYFIVSGELEAELHPEPARMRKGEHFGEVALIYHRSRTATVIALSHAELLELDAKDLHRLLESKPTLRAQIMDQAERRLANTEPAAPGDV